MHMKPAENICDPGDGDDAVSAAEAASNALTVLVRFLARQAAREVFAEERQVSPFPAFPQKHMESDDG